MRSVERGGFERGHDRPVNRATLLCGRIAVKERRYGMLHITPKTGKRVRLQPDAPYVVDGFLRDMEHAVSAEEVLRPRRSSSVCPAIESAARAEDRSANTDHQYQEHEQDPS